MLFGSRPFVVSTDGSKASGDSGSVAPDFGRPTPFGHA
jgi:hypothetical protein